ncbi:MAG: DUF3047 domain-containing protein [Proteobacteria bacterium]|nr:DUF3047 domain-containing protein [Pseudomonadota bacterium]
MVCAAAAVAAHAETPALTAFGAAGEPPAPWKVEGLPNQTKPYTRFAVVDLEGKPALRIEADQSYGNLVHPLAGASAKGLQLAWRWRVDEPIEQADLRTRGGDDTAVKVCVFFDMPLDRVPFVERQVLRAARAKAGEPLPTASVCYVWDPHIAAGTALDNAFTRRMRYKVLESGSASLRHWVAEKRDISADFLALFGDESQDVPPIAAIVVGADADNTHTKSLAYVADIRLEP